MLSHCHGPSNPTVVFCPGKGSRAFVDADGHFVSIAEQIARMLYTVELWLLVAMPAHMYITTAHRHVCKRLCHDLGNHPYTGRTMGLSRQRAIVHLWRLERRHLGRSHSSRGRWLTSSLTRSRRRRVQTMTTAGKGAASGILLLPNLESVLGGN